MKDLIPSAAAPPLDAATVFQKLGLRSQSRWRAALVEPAHADLSEAARFRDALEELGGLYAAFGQFLCWRADLLRTEYLARLRYLKTAAAPIPHNEVYSILSSELGDKGAVLSGTLAPESCWSTLARCAWRTEHKGRPVVVQIARDPIPDAAFEAFEAGIVLIEQERLAAAIRPPILAQFREWARLSDSPARERAYLEALQAVRGNSLALYPSMIPELSAGRVLTMEWIDGEPVAVRIAEGSSKTVQLLAECVLEQICTVSAIDAGFDLDSMVVTPLGKLAIRHANRLVAIPPPLTNSCLKYISAVLASNAPAAAQSLVRLSNGRPAMLLETRLLDELSNLEPELKVNLQFPASAAVFEGNWRALKRARAENPLFLDMMHRNLLATGYWNAETAASAGIAHDSIADAQWPVFSSMLRVRLADMLNREAASDFFLGSGLLFFELMRQMNRMAEGLRENDVSLGVDLEHDGDSKKAHQRIRGGIFIGMLLIMFLVSVRVAISADPPWNGILSAVAASAALALFWFVSRFD